jgi:hypothetical protein
MVDPLLIGFDLPITGTLYPSGFPLELSTNSPEVMRAAEQSWACFPKRFDCMPLRVRVAVADSGPGPVPAVPVFRAQEHLVSIVADAENFAVCDYTRRFGFCWTTRATVADPAYFRYCFLGAAVYVLLAQCEATPVHAACVASGGEGMLLCGVSGAGKTTLAYACARRGWTYVCDDTAILPWKDSASVIGNPIYWRFRADAPDLFSEIGGVNDTMRPNGKATIEILTASLPEIRKAFACPVKRLVFLERRESGPADLRVIPAEQVLNRLAADLSLYDRSVTERHLATLQGLARQPTFELRYSTPQEAVEVLECFYKASSPQV